MLIELAGLPASGKTSFAKKLSKLMRAADMQVRDAQTIAADTTQPNHTPRFVKAKSERALLHRYVRFQRRHPKLDALAVRAMTDAPIRHLLYTMMAASYQGVRDLAAPGDVVIIDEGFVSHAVTTYYEAGNTRSMKLFINQAPRVDLVMFLDASPETAFQRATERFGDGQEQRKAATEKHGDIVIFERRDRMLRQALELYEARRVPVMRFDTNTHRPFALAKQAMQKLQSTKVKTLADEG